MLLGLLTGRKGSSTWMSKWRPCWTSEPACCFPSLGWNSPWNPGIPRGTASRCLNSKAGLKCILLPVLYSKTKQNNKIPSRNMAVQHQRCLFLKWLHCPQPPSLFVTDFLSFMATVCMVFWIPSTRLWASRGTVCSSSLAPSWIKSKAYDTKIVL